jgi:uncharacterized protein YndB with AHSA1/START domain
MSNKKNLIAEKIIEINASAKKVWTAITTDVSVQSFMMGMKPITTWQKGASMQWIGRHEGEEHNMAKGEIINFVSEELLQYTFFYGGYGHLDIPEHYQLVTFRLEKLGENKTRLIVQQGDYAVFAEGENYLQHANTFWEQAGNRLKEICESS